MFQPRTKSGRISPTFATLLLSGTFLITFSGAFFGPLPAEAKRGPKVPAAGSADCKKDADCLVVPDDCCACNQGGKQHAIPKSQKDAYEKARKKKCGGTVCTEMMSQDPSCSMRAFCGAGICELEDAPPTKSEPQLH